ncbi:MAG: metalloregulator ArsR/SmtB family transcription factor [Vagococcus sp.]|uniref:ArsR/SmtB family transcription factor n=1 Tax=Vagococcus sp. TaxID=1933889 RepID=UPI002FC76169
MINTEETLQLLSKVEPEKMSAFFKLMSEEIRFKLTFLLAHEKEMCVSDLAKLVDASVTSTSHHLQILKKNNVIDNRRVGKQIFYFVNNERVRYFINTGLDFHHLKQGGVTSNE